VEVDLLPPTKVVVEPVVESLGRITCGAEALVVKEVNLDDAAAVGAVEPEP
jgi:hypothetical protein